VIDELIQLAKETQAATKRGEDLGLNENEICFYDALAQNESAVQAMGNDELKVIAAELVTSVRRSATIDWTVRESARVRIRGMVRRILRKHGDPRGLQDEATKLVLGHAEVLCAEWAVCRVGCVRVVRSTALLSFRRCEFRHSTAALPDWFPASSGDRFPCNLTGIVHLGL
jgi:hypothetical protein